MPFRDLVPEDAFELPPFKPYNNPWSRPTPPELLYKCDIPKAKAQPLPPVEEREYRAEYGPLGEAFLVLDHTTTIASFDTFKDAETAAKALNEHYGY